MKRFLLLLLSATILFFPPISVYLVFKQARRIQNSNLASERDRIVKSNLSELTMPFTADNRFQMAVSRLSRQMHYENDSSRIKLLHKVAAGKADPYFRNAAETVTSSLDYPCEIAFIVRWPVKPRPFKVYRYGPRLGLTEILENFANERIIAGNPLWTGYFASALETEGEGLIKSSILPFRLDIGMRTLFCSDIGPEAQILALADQQPISWETSLRQKILNSQKDFGIGCYQNSNNQTLYSQWFDDKPELRSKISRFLKKCSNYAENIIIGNYRVSLEDRDQRRDTRLFSVRAQITDNHGNRDLENLILTLLAAISTITFILIGEKIMLNRGFDLPIRYLIPAIFLMLFIQPLFSMFYLANEFLQTNYHNLEADASEKLTENLLDIDQQTNDNFLRRIDLIRSFSSIEKIAAFTGLPYDGSDDFKFCRALLQKLDNKIFSNYFTSLWMCRSDGEFVAISIRDNNDYQPESSESDFTGFFNERFIEILDYLNHGNSQQLEYKKTKLQDGLKGEYSREFFLQLFGSDIFYSFRRYVNFVMDIDTSYKKNTLFGLPITLGDRYHAYLTWHVGERKAFNDFPKNRLELKSQSPRLAISGNERSVDSVGFSLEKVEARQAKLLNIAKTSHVNRTLINTIEKAHDKIVIRQATPCNYSYYTVAGSESIDSFAAYRRNFIEQSLYFLGVLSLLSLGMALAGARYFTRPLRELTLATNQITAGNYDVSIDVSHPDEFSEIGGAFNRIAAGLREGSLLKGFVSESVRREVADFSIDELAEKSELRNSTIVFAGICNFSAFQQSHDEHQTFALLEKLLQAADAATRKYGGEIDKMIEDKVMIVFEHLGENLDYEQRALQTALQISEQIQTATEHRVCAGVNTGITVAGIMGAAEARLSRTVVGDPVNLSARLAALAGTLPQGGVVIAGTLVDAVSADCSCEKLPVSSVKGKTQTVEAWLVKPL